MRLIALAGLLLTLVISHRGFADSAEDRFELFSGVDASEVDASALKGTYVEIVKKDLFLHIDDLDHVDGNWITTYASGDRFIHFTHHFPRQLLFVQAAKIYRTFGYMERNGCQIATRLDLDFSADSKAVNATLLIPRGVDLVRCSPAGGAAKALMSFARKDEP